MTIRRYSLCALLALTAGHALADSQARGEEEPGYLTVFAPRLVHQTLGRATDVTATAEVSIEHRVTYASLDLAMHADVLELRKRIVESAQTACKQLEALYPLADLDTVACTQKAIDDAMERARKVVAAAMASAESTR